MVQEFWAVRCHACGAFQCTQAKKSMGFTCVVCGEKTRRVRAVLMASNDARDCRRYVQMRNAGAGEEQEALGEAKALAEVEARAGWEDDLAEADQYDQCPDGDYDAADTFGVGAGGTLAALERAEELNKEQRGEYERARERDSRGSGGSDGGFQHASSAVGFQFAGREALPKAPRKGTWDAFLDGKGDAQPQPQPPPVAAPKEDDVWDELLE